MATTVTVPPHMQGKAQCFVTGHNKPAVAPTNAKYVRTHPDGSPMLAASSTDTVAECTARWEAAQAEAAALVAAGTGEGEAAAPKRGRGKKGGDDADVEAAGSEA